MIKRLYKSWKLLMKGNDIGLVNDYNLIGVLPSPKNRKQRREAKKQ